MNALPSAAVRRRRAGTFALVPARGFAVAISVVLLLPGDLWADSAYKATSGTVAFTVGSNIPYLKVSGATTAVTGGGQATITGNTATVRNLHFELDPKTFKTGIKLRDHHLQQKVFTAPNGSIPPVTLEANSFTATLNPKTSKWKGQLRGQLSIRGVTKPAVFFATLEKKGAGAVVAATGTVKTSDYGVKTISYAGATVNDDVQVSITALNVQP